jgi:hypothetical protein
VQLFERFLMIQPDTVSRLALSAYSSSGNDMEVALVCDEPPFTTYGLALQRVQLGTVWKEYAFDFTSRNFSSFVNNARLVFRFDGYANPGDVFGIDGVQLAKLNAEPSVSRIIPQDYELSQNYPNPFKSKYHDPLWPVRSFERSLDHPKHPRPNRTRTGEWRDGGGISLGEFRCQRVVVGSVFLSYTSRGFRRDEARSLPW